MATEPTRRLFTRTDYHRMARVGILAPDDRVELLDGEIVEMTPIGPRHAAVVTRLMRSLIAGAGDDVEIRIQAPIVLDDFSEPQPDVAVTAARADDFAGGHPTPAEIHLVIEVADTTLRFDRERKMPRYARAGITEAWLVDLDRDVIEVYREPSANGYRERTAEAERIVPARLPAMEIDVRDMLRR